MNPVERTMLLAGLISAVGACSGSAGVTTDPAVDAAVDASAASAPDAAVTDEALPIDLTAGEAAAPDLPAKAVLVLSPSAITLAGLVNQDSAPTPVRVTNVGQGSSGVLGIAITGADREAFEVKGATCTAPLAAGASCEIQVACRPPDLGAWHAQLVVSGASGEEAAAPMSVYVCQEAELAPNPGLFGMVSVGQTSAPVTFTLRNTTCGPYGPVSFTLSTAEFAVVSDTCAGVPVPSRARCSLGVVFRPAATGERSGRLIGTDATGGQIVVSLKGEGT